MNVEIEREEPPRNRKGADSKGGPMRAKGGQLKGLGDFHRQIAQ
jgi:hypothetical protein